jgi:hypothetical protein
LLAGRPELVIRHGQDLYRLLITSQKRLTRDCYAIDACSNSSRTVASAADTSPQAQEAACHFGDHPYWAEYLFG